MSSFKNFAQKTQPLQSWVNVEAKPKTTFDIREDLKPGDRIYYIPYDGMERRVGTFLRYGGTNGSYNDLEVWANWRGEDGWMPAGRVFRVE